MKKIDNDNGTTQIETEVTRGRRRRRRTRRLRQRCWQSQNSKLYSFEFIFKWLATAGLSVARTFSIFWHFSPHRTDIIHWQPMKGIRSPCRSHSLHINYLGRRRTRSFIHVLSAFYILPLRNLLFTNNHTNFTIYNRHLLFEEQARARARMVRNAESILAPQHHHRCRSCGLAHFKKKTTHGVSQFFSLFLLLLCCEFAIVTVRSASLSL